MIRTLQIGRTGPPQTIEGNEVVTPPPKGITRWIDLEGQTDDELRLLAERFGFHPLTIEDCSHFDQRPKFEDYEEYVFLVTHGADIRTEPGEHLHVLELHTFLGDRYLITVHEEPLPPLESIWNRLKSDGPTARRGADFIRYLIADAMVDALFPVVDQLGNRIEDIEEALIEHRADQSRLEDITRVKRILVALRKMLPAQRTVISQLAKREGEHVGVKTALYFRDVLDHLHRIGESVEANRELLESLLDAYHWTVSQRTNEIVKRLTILSAIFLPLTFITGFFGQNFEGLPFGSERLMAVMLAGCVLVPAVMLWFFSRSDWV